MVLYLKIITFLYRVASIIIWILIACWSFFQTFNWKDNINKYSLLNNYDVEKFLPSLGFLGKSILYPDAFHTAVNLPIFILALKDDDDIRHVHRFLGNFRIYLGDNKLIIYDLGVKKEDILLIRKTCQCLIRQAHLHKYPQHVQNLQFNAYRSLLIQETLQEFGIVFWCNVKMRFLPSSHKLLPSLVEKSKNLGIQVWPSQPLPTSALTHKSTLKFLNAPNRTVYNFLKMAEPDAAIYCNTYRLHKGLMLPWIRCALTESCVAPGGIKVLWDTNREHSLCSIKKPMYKYTGCHRFDSSVFNVILGQLFHYDAIYIPMQRIFKWEHNFTNI